MSAPSGEIPQQHEHQDGHVPRRTRREQTRIVAFIVLAILAILFIAKNSEEVKVNWIIGSGKAPLIIVIVISLLAGILLTRLFDRMSRKRKR